MGPMKSRLFFGRRLIIAVSATALAAFGLAGFTLALLLGVAPFVQSTAQNVVLSLNANLVVVGFLLFLIGYRVFFLLKRLRDGGAAARLQGKVAALFGVVSILPTVTLIILSVTILHVGLDNWINVKTEQATARSLSIARAYLRDHRLSLVRDTYTLGNFLSEKRVVSAVNQKRFDEPLKTLADRRGLIEIVIFDSKGEVFAKAGDIEGLRSANVPQWAIQTAKSGGAPVVIRGNTDRLRTLYWLAGVERFLLVGRALDPQISSHVEGVSAAVTALQDAVGARNSIEARLVVFYVLFGLVFTLASVWAGLMFAGVLAEPVSNLIVAADQVRSGNLKARVSVGPHTDEMGNLLISFNRMTAQLETQRDELITANNEMDQRRRFTGAVLDGVASGVIGIDEAGIIRTANPYAVDALDVQGSDLVFRKLSDVAPELLEIGDFSERQETEVRIMRGGRQRVLLARSVSVSGEHVGAKVITFTDITDLLQAKRQAAWAGVARRIAHEIKNPLTPIQLSAERLKRRYLGTIQKDPDVFSLCCETIIRQVTALRSMVDEFSEFARLPAPKIQPANVSELAQEAIFLLQNEHRSVFFSLQSESNETLIECDPGQIVRAFNNVLINAVHAVLGRAAEEDDGFIPKIEVVILTGDQSVTVICLDNGKGFSPEVLESALEPYVTTKEDGSGLGLSIVQRVIEEHRGSLRIQNRDEGGAVIEIRLPKNLALTENIGINPDKIMVRKTS
jgi:two-component system nitrogen regulation sensor histidine kinase NtrY